MKRKVLRSAALFSLTNLLAGAMPLLLLPSLTRVLSPEDYGMVAMYAIVISAFGALTGLSVHGAVGMRFFDREEIDFPAYVGTCLLILTVSTLLTFLIVLLFLTPLARTTLLPREWLLIAVCVSGAQFLLLTRLSIFQSSKQAGAFAGFRLSQAIIDGTVSLALVFMADMAFEGRLIGMSAAIIIIALASLVSLLSAGLIRFLPKRADILHALRFGLPLIPHVMGGLLLTSADRLLIINLIGMAEAGIYLVAVQISLGVYLIADAFNRAISPWLIEALNVGNIDMDVKLVRAIAGYCAVLLCIGGTFGFIATILLPYVVGGAFHSTGDFLWIIAMGQSIAGVYLIFANVIFYKNRTGKLAVLSITSGTVNIMFTYILLKNVGIAGAAYAFLCTQIVMCLCTARLAQRLRPLPWQRMFTRSS